MHGRREALYPRRPEPGDFIRAAGDRQAIHYEHGSSEDEFENEASAAGLTVAFHARGDAGTALRMADA